MALALEARFEPFSQGRGFITPERVEEIEAIAARHGIYLAPFYNADDQWKTDLSARRNGREDECMGEGPSRTLFVDGWEDSVVASAGTVDPGERDR